MSRAAHALWYLYLLAGLFLARCSVNSVRAGDLWYAGGLATAALLVAVALFRECNAEDQRHAAAVQAERAARLRARQVEPAIEDGYVRLALAAACCERWWTSAGAEHDPASCTRSAR